MDRRQIDRYEQRDKQTHRKADRETDRQTDRETELSNDKHTQAHKQIVKVVGRQTRQQKDSQTDRQTDRHQTDKSTIRQTNRRQADSHAAASKEFVVYRTFSAIVSADARWRHDDVTGPLPITTRGTGHEALHDDTSDTPRRKRELSQFVRQQCLEVRTRDRQGKLERQNLAGKIGKRRKFSDFILMIFLWVRMS